MSKKESVGGRVPQRYVCALSACLAALMFAAPAFAAASYAADKSKMDSTKPKDKKATSEDPYIAYPGFGSDAPQVAVVFDGPYGKAKRAAIYVAENGDWRLVHQGAYNRGSMLSGKGGIGNRFRLITVDEGFEDLRFGSDGLVLTSPGRTIVLYSR